MRAARATDIIAEQMQMLDGAQALGGPNAKIPAACSMKMIVFASRNA
ncbi:hypothetical protein LPN04_32545 [Rugamonas sp. A1-17]|nr:hypothetical protein [Rugamonas sp. A1-17]